MKRNFYYKRFVFVQIKYYFFTGISEDGVSIQIAAPPVDGEANTAIVKYFAEILNVKKANVSLKVSLTQENTSNRSN